jgi:adenosylmethionine-8-amino-7-oxononanoate aminotransferase
MLAPPFIISEHEIDEIVERFTRALMRTMRDLNVLATTT